MRTLSVTVMYSLSAKSLLAAIADFPEIEAYLQRIAKDRRDFLLELAKAFADDQPLPEKDDPEDKLTGLFAEPGEHQSVRATRDFHEATKAVASRRTKGAKESLRARSITHGQHGSPRVVHPDHFHLNSQPTSSHLALLDEERPSVSFSPAEVLEAASQERAAALHDKQVRLLGKAERKRQTMMMNKGNVRLQRHTVRKFARSTGQF